MSELMNLVGQVETIKNNLKTSIRNKGVTVEDSDLFSTYPSKVDSISGGSSATLITKSITQNGTYNASSDSADGYSSVTVAVADSGSAIRTILQNNSGEPFAGTIHCMEQTGMVSMMSMELSASVFSTLTGLTIADDYNSGGGDDWVSGIYVEPINPDQAWEPCYCYLRYDVDESKWTISSDDLYAGVAVRLKLEVSIDESY